MAIFKQRAVARKKCLIDSLCFLQTKQHKKTQAIELAFFIYLQFVFYLSTLPEVSPPTRVRMLGFIA